MIQVISSEKTTSENNENNWLMKPLKNYSKKEKTILIIFFSVMILFFFIYFTGDKSSPPKQEQVLTEAEQREKMIEAQFSAWDGSHIKLTEIIKKSMNDPKSYEHVETLYWGMEDHLIISTTFRGKNVFGGTVSNTVKAKVSLDGESIEILEQF
jgi:hypothetical protein